MFWRKNFDPTSSPGLLHTHFLRENPGDEVDFHPVSHANLKMANRELKNHDEVHDDDVC